MVSKSRGATRKRRARTAIKRGKRGALPAKIPILILTQGEQTECQYFNRLIGSRDWNKGVAITVMPCVKSPDKMALTGQSHLEDYEYVFSVTDVDEFTEQQFGKARGIAAKRSNTKNGKPRLFNVVSYPKFEIWLCAHFRDMRTGCDDKKVTEVEKELSILQPAPHTRSSQHRKHMPDDFPYAAIGEAVKRVIVSEFGYWDPQGSTSIPTMIDMIDELNGSSL